jgi:putative addiction module killer protein
MKYELQSTQTFNTWMNSLKDPVTISKVLARLDRVSNGNFGDFKPLSGHLFELKFVFGAGIRIYYTIKGNEIVLLLAGGNKSSQSRDIDKARTILKNLED